MTAHNAGCLEAYSLGMARSIAFFQRDVAEATCPSLILPLATAVVRSLWSRHSYIHRTAPGHAPSARTLQCFHDRRAWPNWWVCRGPRRLG